MESNKNFQIHAFLNKAIATLHDIKVTGLQCNISSECIDSICDTLVCFESEIADVELNLREEVYNAKES